MAFYSTTAGRIQTLLAGGCWPRRQLHAGIRSISTWSILMELQAGDIQNSMAEYSSTAGRISILFFWTLLGSTPAMQQYKVLPYCMKTHEVMVRSETNTLVDFT